jgi:hypothetical protein
MNVFLYFSIFMIMFNIIEDTKKGSMNMNKLAGNEYS